MVKLWDVGGVELYSYRGHTNWVSSVAFSPDGHYLVSASVDHTVKLWELAGQQGAGIPGHNKEITAVAVSPNGKAVFVAGDVVRAWSRNG